MVLAGFRLFLVMAIEISATTPSVASRNLRITAGLRRSTQPFIISHCWRLRLCFLGCLAVAQDLPDAPSTTKQQTKQQAKQAATASTAEKAWPRTFSSGTDTFSVYQPQVDKWHGDRLYLYSAVEVANPTKKSTNYGVVWFSARAEIDKPIAS